MSVKKNIVPPSKTICYSIAALIMLALAVYAPKWFAILAGTGSLLLVCYLASGDSEKKVVNFQMLSYAGNFLVGVVAIVGLMNLNKIVTDATNIKEGVSAIQRMSIKIAAKDYVLEKPPAGKLMGYGKAVDLSPGDVYLPDSNVGAVENILHDNNLTDSMKANKIAPYLEIKK